MVGRTAVRPTANEIAWPGDACEVSGTSLSSAHTLELDTNPNTKSSTQALSSTSVLSSSLSSVTADADMCAPRQALDSLCQNRSFLHVQKYLKHDGAQKMITAAASTPVQKQKGRHSQVDTDEGWRGQSMYPERAFNTDSCVPKGSKPCMGTALCQTHLVEERHSKTKRKKPTVRGTRNRAECKTPEVSGPRTTPKKVHPDKTDDEVDSPDSSNDRKGNENHIAETAGTKLGEVATDVPFPSHQGDPWRCRKEAFEVPQPCSEKEREAHERSISLYTSTQRALFRAPQFYHPTRSVPPNAEYLLPPLEGFGTATPPRLTVVFDLDETLVSNRQAHLHQPAVLRPYARELLASLPHHKMEIVLWTASTDETAFPVLAALDPSGAFFEHCIFRNAHWYTEPHHTKDLRLLGRPLDRVLLVDNAPCCGKMQPRHTLLVEDFTVAPCGEQSQDRTLMAVWRVLEQITHYVLGDGASLLTSLTDREAAPRTVPRALEKLAAMEDLVQVVHVMPPTPDSGCGKAVEGPHNHRNRRSVPLSCTLSSRLLNPPKGPFFRLKKFSI